MTQADRPEVQEAYELAKPEFAAIGIDLLMRRLGRTATPAQAEQIGR